MFSGGFNINSYVDFKLWFQVADIFVNSQWVKMFGLFVFWTQKYLKNENEDRSIGLTEVMAEIIVENGVTQ